MSRIEAAAYKMLASKFKKLACKGAWNVGGRGTMTCIHCRVEVPYSGGQHKPDCEFIEALNLYKELTEPPTPERPNE